MLASSFLRKYRSLDAAMNRKGGPMYAALNNIWVAVLMYSLVALALLGFWPGSLTTQGDYSIRSPRGIIVLDGAFAVKKAKEQLANCTAAAKASLLPTQLLLAAEANLSLESIYEIKEANRKLGAKPVKLTKPQLHLWNTSLSVTASDGIRANNRGLNYDTTSELADKLVRGLCAPALNQVAYVTAIAKGEPEKSAAAEFNIAEEDRLEADLYFGSDIPVYVSYLASFLATFFAIFVVELYRERREATLSRRADAPDSLPAK